MQFIRLLTLTLSVSLFLYSCGADNSNGSTPLKDSLSSKPTYIIDTLDIARSYSVKVAKAYIFDLPDTIKRREDYLVEKTLVSVDRVSNGFAYFTYIISNDTAKSGWIQLSALEQIFFTPPKGAIIDSTK